MWKSGGGKIQETDTACAKKCTSATLGRSPRHVWVCENLDSRGPEHSLGLKPEATSY